MIGLAGVLASWAMGGLVVALIVMLAAFRPTLMSFRQWKFLCNTLI